MSAISTCFKLLTMLSLVLAAQGCSTGVRQTSYGAPEQATASLVSAARSDSTLDMQRVLGPEAIDMLKSGDPVRDQQDRDAFLNAYTQNHQLVTDAHGDVTLLVGKDNWPFPIPLVLAKDGWRFDTAQGKDEILARRIGRNELDAVQVCRAIVDAQFEYAALSASREGLAQYATKILSDPGKRNGLFWTVSGDETPSPLGPLVADAAAESYTSSAKAYHGYRYRILQSQGPSAKGGAANFVINGKMVGGFAVLAYPAEYGKSGIMSLVVSHDGIVYQADLGAETAKIASAMTAYDPGAGWSAVGSESK